MRSAHFTLANGLQVTLRHAPQLKRCAAAVRVRAGSHDAPPAWPGLAHFLEHLFFLGNARFAIDDALMRYVQRQGGQVNASTRERTTDFFFEVPVAAFDGGLTRLCEMLARPAADLAQQQREREVIHAEFIAWARNPETQRQFALLQSVSARHPLGAFHAGNRYSLPVCGARFQQALKDFHQHFYHAGQMTLSLVGPQPLATLRAMAERAGSRLAPGQPRVQGPAPALLAEPANLQQLPAQLDVLYTYEHLPEGAAQAISFLETWLADTRPGGLLADLRKRRWLQGFTFSPLYAFEGQALLHAHFALADNAPADQVQSVLEDWLRFLRGTEPSVLTAEFARLQVCRQQAAGALELARRDSSGQPFAALDKAGLAALHALLARFSGPPQHAWQWPAAEPLLAATLDSGARASTPVGLHPLSVLPTVREYAVVYLRWQVRSARREQLRHVLERALRPLMERAMRASVDLQFSACEHYWQLRCAGAPAAVVAVMAQALSVLRTPGDAPWHSDSPPEPALIPLRLLMQQLPRYIVGREDGPQPSCRVSQADLDALWQHSNWHGITCGLNEAAQQALNAVLAEVPGAPGAPTPPTTAPAPQWHHVALPEGEHALLVFCPAPHGSEAIHRLLAHRLQGPFYQRLRVELQLGYAVFSALRQIQGVTGLLLGVQSPSATPAEMLGHIRSLLAEFSHALPDDDDARQALAAQCHEADMGNAEVAEWAWQTHLYGSEHPSLPALQAAILAVEPHALEHAAAHLLDNALYLASAPPPDGLLPRAQQPFTHV